MSVISGPIASTQASKASKKGADQAADSQRQALEQQQAQYEQQRTDFQPFMQAGTNALPSLHQMVYSAPADGLSYMGQAQQKAYNNAMLSRGLLGGGRGAYGAADIQRADAERNYTMKYNQLMDMLKVGQGAAGSVGQAGQTMSNAYGQAGQNLGGIFQNSANNRASLYSGMGGLTGQTAGLGIKAYQSGLFGGGSSAASAPAYQGTMVESSAPAYDWGSLFGGE